MISKNELGVFFLQCTDFYVPVNNQRNGQIFDFRKCLRKAHIKLNSYSD
jgi:hypothetical protein